jgi:pimeloyl-ACP methyl ester carboxylesterase
MWNEPKSLSVNSGDAVLVSAGAVAQPASINASAITEMSFIIAPNDRLLCVKYGVVVAAIAGLASGQVRTRDVVRNGEVTIEVIAEGRGPLIVLLPSLGRDSEEFDPVAERIAAAGFRVLRPQPRGFARSAGPLKNLTLHDFAKDVAAVVEHEKAGPAILAGHAFGHYVAKMTAVDFPKVVRGVALIGAGQKAPNPEARRSVTIATDPSQPEAERLKHLKILFFYPGNDPTSWLTGFHASVQASQAAARDATRQEEYWGSGTVPLLDIQGEGDPYRPASSRNELVEEFGAKRVSTVLIPRAAHAIIVEQPAAVADAIIAWARRIDR